MERQGSKTSLSIVIVDDDHVRGSLIKDGLSEAGYQRIEIARNFVATTSRIELSPPDILIVALGCPPPEVLQVVFELTRDLKRPVVIFVDRSDRLSIEAAVAAGVAAYVVDGLRQDRVAAIIDLAISRFDASSKLARELADVRAALHTRKVVDRAKGILMTARGISEADAYALLRQTAMTQNRKLAETAESLISAAGLLSPGDCG